jgi:hypothetical protein
VPIDVRRTFSWLLIAGLAGAVLFLPTISAIGDMLSPTRLAPAATPVPPVVGDAIWARANGGRATELRPLNPFTIARMVTCHALAEHRSPEERDAAHDECARQIPAIEAIAYLSSVNMRDDGVWQTPRVPFIQIANMTKVTGTWTRAQVLDTLAERAEFPGGVRGVEHAAASFFRKTAAALTAPEAALLAAMIGDRRVDPWCQPKHAAQRRRAILERMRDNGAIDTDAFNAADQAELGIVALDGHKCEQVE